MSTKNATKTALRLVLPQDLRAELQALADERTISLSALIRLALTQYVKAHR